MKTLAPGITRTRTLLISLFLLIPSFSLSQLKPFTFAFLSDTHVGSGTGAEDLAITVEDLNAIDSVAFVVLTGDITEFGANKEFEETKIILNKLNKPYYIIPGNHDTKWSESGCSHFAKVFGADRFVFQHGGYTFFGLHEGPMMRMGDGHFAPEDIRWVDSLLATIPEQAPLFFLTHYPLDSGLDNWFEMTDRLRKRNTQAVLVGHGHSNRKMEFEGIPGIMGRSNLRAQAKQNGYNLVTLQADSAFFHVRHPGKETRPAWHAIGLGTRTYEESGTAFSRPDYIVNSQYTSVTPVWKVSTGYTITGGAAIAGDRVIAGDRSGVVRALNAETGKELWKFRSVNAVLTTPEVSGNAVVATSTDGNVYALDLKTGKELWHHSTGLPNVACPAIQDEIVYVGGSDGKFRAIRLKDGSAVWTFDSVKAFIETKALVTATSVIFGAWDSYLYCLDKANGSLIWKWNNGTNGRGLSPAAEWPVAANGRIFVVAPDRAATVLEEKDGSVVWRSKAHQVRESAGISKDGARFYAKCMNDTLFAYDAASNVEKLVWATDCKYGYDIDPSMPMERDGKVFFGTKNGLVFCLDGKTGSIEWTHKISNTIVNTVAPIDGKSVVVTDFDGNIVLLRNSD